MIMSRQITRYAGIAIVAFLSVWVLNTSQSKSAMIDDTAKSVFHSKYPAALDDLENQFRHVEASGTFLSGKKPDGSYLDLRMELKRSDNSEKLELIYNDVSSDGNRHPKVHFAYVVNNRQAFELQKNDNLNGSYIINKYSDFQKTDASTNNLSGDTASIKHTIKDRAGKFIFSPFKTEFFDMKGLIDGKFAVISMVQQLNVDNENIIRLTLVESTPENKLFSGTIDLLPERSWAIRRYDLETKVAISGMPSNMRTVLGSKIDIRYENGKSTSVIPKRVIHSRRLSDITTPTILDITNLNLSSSIRDNEFSIQQYGLPDVSLPLSPSTSNHYIYILLISSVLLMAIAIYLYRRHG